MRSWNVGRGERTSQEEAEQGQWLFFIPSGSWQKSPFTLPRASGVLPSHRVLGSEVHWSDCYRAQVVCFRRCIGRAGNWERGVGQTGVQNQVKITARPWDHIRIMAKDVWELEGELGEDKQSPAGQSPWCLSRTPELAGKAQPGVTAPSGLSQALSCRAWVWQAVPKPVTRPTNSPSHFGWAFSQIWDQLPPGAWGYRMAVWEVYPRGPSRHQWLETS